SKDRQFMNVVDLPRRRGQVRFEIALGAEPDVHQLLERHGWGVRDAVNVSRELRTYREFIQQSRAEFTVAKEQYVLPRSGWFSDRSACYLAAGRPVITQDTGFPDVLPTGKGLFAFRTLDDILAAVDAIEGDVSTSQRAAQEIAAEYFAAEKV